MRVGIAVRRVKQVKNFFGKIQPAVLVKIAGVVLSDMRLEIALPEA
jgi:hypothetical protein